MKYTTLALAAFCAINLASCKKDSGAPLVVTVPIVDSQAYMLSNIQDLSFLNNDMLVWEIPVEWKTGKQEKVTLALGALPANVKASPDTVTGLPSFTPTFTLTAKYATPGKYPINVYATSATLGTRKYEVNLTVKPSANCAADYIGSYPATSSTRNDTTFGTYSAMVTSSDPYTLRLSCNCKIYYSSVDATINCDNGSISFPTQDAGSSMGDLINGTGQMLSNGKIVLKYSYYDNYYHNWKNYTDTLQN